MSLIQEAFLRTLRDRDRRRSRAALARLDPRHKRVASWLYLLAFQPTHAGCVPIALDLDLEGLDDQWIRECAKGAAGLGLTALAANWGTHLAEITVAKSYATHDPEAMLAIPHAVIEHAETLTFLDDPQAVARWSALGPLHTDRDASRRVEGLVTLGAIEQAIHWLHADGERLSWPLGLRAWRLRFALWRGELDRVAATPDESEPVLHLLIGAAQCMRGHYTEAAAHLGKAPDDSVETWMWRSELARQQGHDFTHASRQAWTLVGPRDALPRLFNMLAMNPSWQHLRDENEGENPRKVGARAALEAELAGLLPVPRVWDLQDILERLGPNRSQWWAAYRDGEWQPGHVGISDREWGRRTQALLHARPVADVLAAHEQRAPLVNRAPKYLMYWGETLLWVGQYAKALALFNEALDAAPQTLWARIGKGAAQLYLDQPQAAVNTFAALTFDGPTVFAYRGEALAKLGRVDDARRQLLWAIRAKPTRLSAWMLLATLPEVNPAFRDGLIAHLTQACPHWGALHDGGLEAALASLHGNRSSQWAAVSCGPYLRFLPWDPDGWVGSATAQAWLATAPTEPPARPEVRP